MDKLGAAGQMVGLGKALNSPGPWELVAQDFPGTLFPRYLSKVKRKGAE